MKYRNRPPLQLTNEDAPLPEVADHSGAEPPQPLDPLPEAVVQPEPTRERNERPLSERRRRMLEEQRLAEEREASAARIDIDMTPSSHAPVVDRSTETDKPLATFERSSPPAVRAQPSPRAATASSRQPYWIAGAASVVWIGAIASWAAYELGAGGASFDPLRLATYLLIALAPVGLAIMLAQAVRQGAGLAAETRRARDLAEALVAPTALAAQQTGAVLQSLRSDIDHAAIAAERARTDMTLLRETLVEETTRLNEAAEIAGRTARRLAESLGRERDEMTKLGVHLDSQSAGVIDAVERQSRMVADASDLAQAQLREAEAALASRAADLAAAAGEAQDAARIAAEDLARQTIRLETAGSGVAEQIHSVEEGLGQQRAALVTTAYQLRTDQEDFSAQVESQRAQLIEQLSATRSAAGELDQTSQNSAEALRELVEAATDQFRALVDMSQREADGFDAATKMSLDRFESLAAETRDALMEETRRALEQMRATAEDSRAAAADAAEQARLRTDRLGEALFDAAQKADQAADARIEDARRIVNESAGLVEQTGERAVQRVESLLDRLSAALSEVDAAIAEVDERSARLPEEARSRADSIRATVEEGLASLAAASRKAAEETEALDVGFQDRVRRNYDMLTEAVRLMGVVSGDAPPPRRREPPEPDVRPVRAAPEEPAKPRAPTRTEDRSFGMRGRLRLAPSEPPPAPPAPPAASDRLDWDDLVGDDDPREAPLDLDTPSLPPAEAEALSERVAAAIRRMGVDPNALLPRARVEEAARAVSHGDTDGARHIVRRVAPAAVRSVSRRVLSDPELRADAERYVRGMAAELAALAKTGDRTTVHDRLSSNGGRAFMLLDAAVGDLG